MSFLHILFILSTIFTIGGALGVLIVKDLMHACVYLLACLFGVAGLYATLGADFLAATQLVVYAGGVVILMLFAIMLTGGGRDSENKYGIEKTPAMGNLKTYIIALVSVSFVLSVIYKIVFTKHNVQVQGFETQMEPTVTKIGTLLITDHVLAFEISSILLLGALVGAAVISRPIGRS